MILIGKSGLFKEKKKDGTLLDISGKFEGFRTSSIPEIIEQLRNELDKWFQMPLNEIIESNFYSILPLDFKIDILYHMKYDYRFKGDLALFDTEIEKLKQRDELQTQKQIYDECFKLALDSKQDALSHLEDWKSTTQRKLLVSKVNPHLSDILDKNLLKSRMEYLFEIESFINDSNFFDDPSDEDIKDDYDNIFDQNVDFQEFIEKIDDEKQERFMYCHELGIIKHLKELIEKSNQKLTLKKVYPLLSLITGMKVGTIKRLITFSNNTDNASNGNPFKNDKLINRVNETLTNLGLR